MEQSIDVLILGGTEGARKLNFGGREDYKQFIEIGGRTIIEYVIDAALRCEDSRRVYVVTDAERLGAALRQRPPANPDKLTIVPQKENLVSNIREVVSLHALPDAGLPPFDYESQQTAVYVDRNPEALQFRMVGLYSDTIFIQPEDISRFIETSDPEVDYEIGLATEESLRAVEKEVGEKLCTPETKTALFPVAGTRTRHNNMIIGYPMSIPDQVWALPQQIYDNRYILTKDGKKNVRNWFKILGMLRKYKRSYPKGSSVYRGVALAAGLWRSFKKAKDGDENARRKLTRERIETVAFYLSGRTLHGGLHMSDVAMPTFDIDNEDMLERLTADGGYLFNRLMRVQRQYPLTPEQELERFVEQHDDLFNHEEPVPLPVWQLLVKDEAVPEDIGPIKIKRLASSKRERPFYMREKKADER